MWPIQHIHLAGCCLLEVTDAHDILSSCNDQNFLRERNTLLGITALKSRAILWWLTLPVTLCPALPLIPGLLQETRQQPLRRGPSAAGPIQRVWKCTGAAWLEQQETKGKLPLHWSWLQHTAQQIQWIFYGNTMEKEVFKGEHRHNYWGWKVGHAVHEMLEVPSMKTSVLLRLWARGSCSYSPGNFHIITFFFFSFYILK